jgi:L-iditol 2-dehydrogenase
MSHSTNTNGAGSNGAGSNGAGSAREHGARHASIILQPRVEIPKHMSAAVLYGPEDLRVEAVPVPSIGENDVLVKVEAALTCGTDLKVWKAGFHARMIEPPAVFGHELAGVVAAKGRAVNDRFQVGMRVVAANSAPCGSCFYCQKGQANLCEDLLFNNGAYAEYARIPARIVEQNLLRIPDHVPFRDAAMAEPLACVLRGVSELNVRAGDTAVVIGCGAIGLKFVRVLASRDVKVIALARRESQLQVARKLGAAVLVNVSEIPDVREHVLRLTQGERGADAVIEAAGTTKTWEWALQMVRKGGVVNMFSGCPRGSEVTLDPSELHYSEITIKSTFHHTPRFIRESLELISRGDIRPGDFITGEIPLKELPQLFEQMKTRSNELKTAVIP